MVERENTVEIIEVGNPHGDLEGLKKVLHNVLKDHEKVQHVVQKLVILFLVINGWIDQGMPLVNNHRVVRVGIVNFKRSNIITVYL